MSSTERPLWKALRFCFVVFFGVCVSCSEASAEADPAQEIINIAASDENSNKGISSSASNNEVSVNGNSVTINGVTNGADGFNGNIIAGSGGYWGIVIGGYQESGDASDNTLSVSDIATSAGEVNAGFTGDGNSSNNTTNVTNVNAAGAFVHGGYVTGGDGDANDNTVNVNGGTYGEIHGAHANTGNAENNTVNFFDGTVLSDIGAGYSNSGNVVDNVLNIYNGTINATAYAGRASYYETANGDATGNTLNVYGGTLNGAVYGGWAPNGVSEYNTINIYGGTFNGDIYGGEASEAANYNTVNIYGGAGEIDLSNSTIYAGHSDAASSSDAKHGEGNALNIIGIKDLEVKNVSGFETLNITMPENIANGDSILTLTDTNGTNLSETAVSVSAKGTANLNTGDTITLMKNTSGITVSNITSSGYLTKGVSLDYGLSIEADDNAAVVSPLVLGGSGTTATVITPTISAVIGNPASTLKPQTEIFSQSNLVGPAFLNLGTERLLSWLPPEDDFYDAEDDKKDLGEDEQIERPDFTIFANASASSLRIKTGGGSYLDNRAGGFDVGAARTIENGSGRLNIAPIFDYGHDTYDAYLANGFHGYGSSKYYAGGLIARQTNDNGFYYEGSFRVGRVETDFASDDFDSGAQTVRSSYSMSAPCWAGHLNVGLRYKIDDDNTLDLYGIYFHSHQNGMSGNLSTGEHYSFDSVNNYRIRTGMRFVRNYKGNQRFYSGLAYQYESQGDAKATYLNYTAPSSGSKGSSGMLELGWQIKPDKNSAWMADLNATGWVGHQKGFTLQLKLKKAF